MTRVSFQTDPSCYRHWRLTIDGPVATLAMDVDENGGLNNGYELKLNSYDLGVDIELYDAVQRLRFEHPEVKAVTITSAKDKIFCAGANIRMLATASHEWKVNFCKFTNETRNGIEDASENSGQVYLAALNGTASGGGYELALACERIMLVDDRSSSVSLPELPLLGVLPGTGGLTRVTDKRHVRRDLADYFSTRSEGLTGKKAVAWKLVDEAVPRAKWDETVEKRAQDLAAASTRAGATQGITLNPLHNKRTDRFVQYRHVAAELDRAGRAVAITVRGPDDDPPASPAGIKDAEFWTLAMTRELDDLILDLRTNETELGSWVLRTEGDPEKVLAYDRFLLDNQDHWLVNEILLYLKRTLKRLDVTSRSLIALIEPGSCFAGSLLELALAADRSYMLDTPPPDAPPLDGAPSDAPPPDAPLPGGAPPDAPALDGAPSDAPALDGAAGEDRAVIRIGAANLGLLPMSNGLSRLATRFYGDKSGYNAIKDIVGRDLAATEAAELGLVTFAPDDLDWDEEVRIALEERASFSPDALTGMEANYRFAGPETMETKIFGRLTAWQNWIFNRPNAAGQQGALNSFGTGQRPQFDRKRV